MKRLFFFTTNDINVLVEAMKDYEIKHYTDMDVVVPKHIKDIIEILTNAQ